MAVSSAEALKLTNADYQLVENLERRIDSYLGNGWAGPERPFDTEINDLKWAICDELRRRYDEVGWWVSFTHPLSTSVSSFSVLEGAVKPKALPTLICFNPKQDMSKMPIKRAPKKQLQATKKVRRK